MFLLPQLRRRNFIENLISTGGSLQIAQVLKLRTIPISAQHMTRSLKFMKRQQWGYLLLDGGFLTRLALIAPGEEVL
jgi:hypothetical protein